MLIMLWERASIKSIRSRSARSGILERLLQSSHFPFRVIQTFVEFSEGVPLVICTWIGSKGSPSFDQKNTRYSPALKICGISKTSLAGKTNNEVCGGFNNLLQAIQFAVGKTIIILPFIPRQNTPDGMEAEMDRLFHINPDLLSSIDHFYIRVNDFRAIIQLQKSMHHSLILLCIKC